jgi:hypothetical protein
MLQSDREPGDDRGQVELFGETQFGTLDDHFAVLAVKMMAFNQRVKKSSPIYQNRNYFLRAPHMA